MIFKTLEEVQQVYPVMPIKKAHNLVGQRFGFLTVLYRTPNPPEKDSRWVCQCDCGNYKSFLSSNIKRQHSTRIPPSCGCQSKQKLRDVLRERNVNKNKNNLLGNKIGYLTVKEYLGLRPNFARTKIQNTSWYLCQCDCGNNIEVSVDYLTATKENSSCGCKTSKGEAKIRRILDEHQINYKTQFIFPDLKDKINLRFDFAIFDSDNNLLYLIEYDGIQHFDKMSLGGFNRITDIELINQKFQDEQNKDTMKNQYCKTHNIILKRIPYYDFNIFTYEDIISDKYNI